MKPAAALALALLVVSLGAGCAGLPSPGDVAGYERSAIYGADRHFKLDWEPGERRGRPVVSGHVYSDFGYPIRDVRLKVESLDAAGAVVRTTVGYVPGRIGLGMSVYFEVPVPERAAGYRVSVLMFDFDSSGRM